MKIEVAMNTLKSLSAALLALALCSSAYAEESKVKETAKEVGNAVGTAAREIAQGTKKVVKKVAKVTKEVAVETGHAFRDGAKEVKKAATSDIDRSRTANDDYQCGNR